MGLCMSDGLTKEEQLQRQREQLENDIIDAANDEALETDEAVMKLLLLGAGESGKSTLFKQMITLYGKGFSEDDKKAYTTAVYNNTITSMKTLIEYSDKLFEDPVAKIRPNAEESKRFITDCSDIIEIDEVVAQHLKTLWADSAIQSTFNRRSEFQLLDSAKYFFERLDIISKPDYIPEQQDVLRTRVRTTGIVETEFEIDSNRFKMCDVGGQRNERKKWIHCFENVTALIFVAAMSEYDQMLYEDHTINRMSEALGLFEETCNSRWFEETSMILFLNKRDLFAEKVVQVDMSCCFPDYSGGLDYDSACTYLQTAFKNKNRSDSKEVYCHVTCATDTSNVRHVFNSVKDIIIRQSLREGGLM